MDIEHWLWNVINDYKKGTQWLCKWQESTDYGKKNTGY